MFRLVAGAAETHFALFSIGRCSGFALSALTAGSHTNQSGILRSLGCSIILFFFSHICTENRKDQMNYIQKGDCYDISENWELSQPVLWCRIFSKWFSSFSLLFSKREKERRSTWQTMDAQGPGLIFSSLPSNDHMIIIIGPSLIIIIVKWSP